MVQIAKAKFYRILYGYLRLNSRVRNLFARRLKSSNKWEIDSQKTNYEAVVDNILKTEFNFRKFRRNFDYCEILENVTFRQGFAHLDRIKILEDEKLNFKVNIQNDFIGSPVQFNYPEFEKVSPTTLRYISIALEIKKIFGPELSGDFVEIGGGYGGQFSILKNLFRIENYGVYDLPNVQKIIKRYLESINQYEHVEFLDLETSISKKWDLVISNNAFSELPKNLQESYISKVLSHSRRGYLIMNSGRENFTMRSNGKLSLEDLQKLLPSFEIFEELPKTGLDNYVIIWGHKN